MTLRPAVPYKRARSVTVAMALAADTFPFTSLSTRLRQIMGTLLLIVAFATAFVVVPASPALAHDMCVSQGRDVGCVRYDHRRLDACDREADGHRVYAVATNGLGDRWTVSDPNGADPGCGQRWVPNPPIRFLQVCEMVTQYRHVCSARVRV